MHHKRAQSLLVTAEMALAVVLVIGAALLIRSFLVIRNVNPGFNPHNVLTIRMLLAGQQFTNTERATQLIRESVRRIRAIPGVEAAATSCCVPLETPWQTGFQIAGRPEGPTSRGVAVWTPASSSRYFEVLQIPVLRGRGLTESDESGPPVAIINETLAKQFWPNSDPLNQRIIIGYESPPRQIIGIVGNLHDTGLDRVSRPNIYEPLIAGREIAWIIRTHGAPQSVRPSIQNETDPGEWRPAGWKGADDGGSLITIHGRRDFPKPGAYDLRLLGTISGCNRSLRINGTRGIRPRPRGRNPASSGSGIG